MVIQLLSSKYKKFISYLNNNSPILSNLQKLLCAVAIYIFTFNIVKQIKELYISHFNFNMLLPHFKELFMRPLASRLHEYVFFAMVLFLFFFIDYLYTRRNKINTIPKSTYTQLTVLLFTILILSVLHYFKNDMRILLSGFIIY